VAPVISGTLLWGNELTTTNGTWSNSPTGYTYQWKRNGSNISGATANTYTTTLADWDQDITCEVTASNGSGSGTPATSNTLVPTTTEGDFFHTTIAVTDGNANAFVKTPLHLHQPPAGGWPLVVCFQGDGTSGNTTRTFSAVAMSTGDNLTYTHSPTAALYRIMCSSIVIKVNGTPVAWGKPGGVIEGDGVTGSITNFDRDEANENTSPTISVTFDSSQSGNTITYDYVDSTMLAEGSPRWVNLGDTLDERCVYVTIQNILSTTDFKRDYCDKTIQFAWVNYDINPNRISFAGISRGGRQIIDRFSDAANSSVLKSRYVFYIDETTGEVFTSAGAGRVASGVASIVCGTASYGGTFTAANYTDIGIAIVHGTSDGTLTNSTPGFAATLGGNNEPPYILNIPGGFHNYDVWDGKCYKRLYRVGPAVGSITTAEWDWVDFILKYSKDALECATLFVEQAEKRRYGTEKDIIDYRQAKRKVDALSSSDEKTALLVRLATLKTAIDNGGTRWVVNFHNTGNDEASPYNNIGSSVAGTTISNIVDFDGGASTLDVELDTDPGVGVAAITSSRRSHVGGFTLKANNAGLGLSGWPFATFKMTGVPSGTYTLRFYNNHGSANFSTSHVFWASLNSQTKDWYANINTLIGYVEFTGVPHSALAQFDIASTSGNPYLTMMEIYKHP
jgi:hypothetical protein